MGWAAMQGTPFNAPCSMRLAPSWITLPRFGKQGLKQCVQALLCLALMGLVMPVVSAAAQTDVAKTRMPVGDPARMGATEVAKTPPVGAAVAAAAAAVATSVRVTVLGSRTVFELAVSKPVTPQVFVLSNPDRIVVDVPELDFNLPADAGRVGAGLITGFRYGLFGAGRSRIVIDVTRGVRVTRAAMAGSGSGLSPRLEIEVEGAAGDWAPATLPAAASAAPPKAFAERKAGSKFVVMIDPGHGGIDGGAISGSQVIEKDITLAVARQLKAALDARQRYDVRLTRSADTFVSLDARVELSQAASADLFISIHADSVGDAAVARTARGGAIYTLSETASNQAAQQFADKENAADAAGGLGGANDSGASQVNSILADLVKRETHNFSLQFKNLLVDRLRPTNILGRDPSRAAAFKVLRQMQTPTVLLELGFLTHEIDAQQMQTIEWQKRIAAAIATAVDSYAARRVETAR